MPMFSRTGVTRSTADTHAMVSLARSYMELSAASMSAQHETSTAVYSVLQHNSGPAATAFEAATTGPGSVQDHLHELAEQAKNTSNAYAVAAAASSSAQASMNAFAADAERRFQEVSWQLIKNMIVREARQGLMALENNAAQKIREAFSRISLPPPMVTTNYSGDLDPALEDEWRLLEKKDPELLKDMIQRMADEYARENGLEPITIQWDSIESTGGGDVMGQYSNGEITLNVDQLGNPRLLHTVIHEMEHARQYAGMRQRAPGSGDVVAGMDEEEGQRWRELNEQYVREKGEQGNNESYRPRPVEVGARRAGREFVNDMTLEEFNEYKDEE